MIEFPHQNPLVLPVRIHSYPNDPNLNALRDVAHEINQQSSLKWDYVGESLTGNQTGDSYVRVSPISEDKKNSHGYFWCVGVTGFGNHLGIEKSFLSHGQDDVMRQLAHIRDATRRLLDMCGETSDFVIFGGQNNLPDASHAERTRNYSLEVRKELAQMIISETNGRAPIVIDPDTSDNHLTDLIGKGVLIDTPTRSIHIFEKLSFRERGQIAPYKTPEQRAVRRI